MTGQSDMGDLIRDAMAKGWTFEKLARAVLRRDAKAQRGVSDGHLTPPGRHDRYRGSAARGKTRQRPS